MPPIASLLSLAKDALTRLASGLVRVPTLMRVLRQRLLQISRGISAGPYPCPYFLSTKFVVYVIKQIVGSFVEIIRVANGHQIECLNAEHVHFSEEIFVGYVRAGRVPA